MTVVNRLIQVTRKFSKDIPAATQGIGGNVSAKSRNRLFIKPSGRRLDQLNRASDLAALEYSGLRRALLRLGTHPSELQLRNTLGAYLERSAQNLRPSMETPFHALLSKKFIFHLHSLVGTLLAEAYFSSSRVRKWLHKSFPHLKISALPYIRPGVRLALALRKRKSSFLYLLRNHGIILAFETPRELKNWSVLEESFLRFLRAEGDFKQLRTRRNLESLVRWYWPRRNRHRLRDLMLVPDAAVFATDLKRLNQCQSLRTLLDSSKMLKNSAELWIAMNLLKDLWPGFRPLSKNECRKLRMDPNEVYRKKRP